MQEVHLLMPEYVQKVITRCQHSPPRKPQYQPHLHVLPKYGKKIFYGQDISLVLDKKTKKFIQEVTVTFLFYTCTIDCTMLTALSTIAAEQY